MARKRVHEIAKERGMSSSDLLARLHAAGIEAKAAASSVEEADALRALGDGAAGPAGPSAGADRAPAPAAAPAPSTAEPAPASPGRGGDGAPKQRPTRSSLAGERAPGSAGGRRRVVIDSQASRRPDGRG